MSESPETPWTSPKSSPHSLEQRRLPPTPAQRRMGTRIGLGVIMLALLIIVLLDHFGVIH